MASGGEHADDGVGAVVVEYEELIAHRRRKPSMTLSRLSFARIAHEVHRTVIHVDQVPIGAGRAQAVDLDFDGAASIV